MNISSKVKKWGNSASIRIPSEVLAASSLKLDDVVSIKVEDHRIIIEATRKKYHLDDLLGQIDDQDLYAEVDFGEPVGNEEW